MDTIKAGFNVGVAVGLAFAAASITYQILTGAFAGAMKTMETVTDKTKV